ncbi:hybrid sensor histidine kinase/response regulator [Nostoc sp. 'Peltigera membranacea cyanobiont' 210A]|uniref:hybrid sensor histidine kinase/response regulator n=1 Tax=Nostoc sp. 'Peltigera membranacea cyanobiont' 210A TaxID=2014529 RepID=UPI000B9534CA|nr:response regulator [Nostoc sp. 'Peltigera membranacea cyanobiont' 210A]OYD92997.1 hybrid sensor histidine kinase/response regulator [Nostoc sp. 'Peltigera membranacea cyanobiont' 210A]
MSEPRVTILHVDDNEANRYVVTRILQNAGFIVVEAATGTTGLEAVANFQPDLIILDVQLPDISGFEVCRQIKANPETAFIPVLHLSASFVQSQDKAEGLDSGADAYLVQPVEPIELLATLRSLLRIRRAEEAALSSAREWQTTFDSMNDGVSLVDREGRIMRCNRAMMQLFCKPSHEILGYAHHELMGAELGIGDGACFRRAKETHQRQVLEFQSQQRWFAKTIDPVLDGDGNLTGAVFILSDITERKRAEALLQEQNDRLNQLMISLQQQTEQAQQANRIKDEFLAVLSHELRSPLNPILGWARILQKSHQDAAKTQYALETIERNAKLQAQLIEDLLDVSRILQGKLSLNTLPVGLTFTIKAALETVRLAAEAKSIQIQTIFEPNVGQVLGDSGRLQQVVWNLLANAIKFTSQGGRVEVRLESIKDEVDTHPAEYTQITVSDTGRGISGDFLPYVFDYFRQADGTTTRKFGGLGLGLAIVRHLVELHGGTVQAASPGEEQGAVFTVKLPLIAASKLNQVNTADRDRSDFNLNGLQTLLVDDDRDSREFIAFVLEQYGAQVTEVDSAHDALNNLMQTKFDLLISDIGMPDMDGYTLIRQIRKQSPDRGGEIPAIALTAYAGETDRQQALAAGFQQHISKPIELEVLIQAILTIVTV